MSTQTPAPPAVPRLVEDVVPDDRDDPEIILNTTTVSSASSAHPRLIQPHLDLFDSSHESLDCVSNRPECSVCSISTR